MQVVIVSKAGSKAGEVLPLGSWRMEVGGTMSQGRRFRFPAESKIG